MPVPFNQNAKSITLVLIGYSIIQIILFTTLQTASHHPSPTASFSLFQISIACQCLLLLEGVIAVVAVTYNTLYKPYKIVSFLFLLTRFLSLMYIFVVEGEVGMGDRELTTCLEIFSIGVGVFEILIVYSQTKMVSNIQSILI